jgi:hypothetical protein
MRPNMRGAMDRHVILSSFAALSLPALLRGTAAFAQDAGSSVFSAARPSRSLSWPAASIFNPWRWGPPARQSDYGVVVYVG